jgi:phytoene synthase
MTEATPSTERTGLDWCRQRLLVPGHPLALTLRYADAGLRDRLLALHALISEIAAVPGAVSDPGVARRKLDWWRDALTQSLPHPAIRAWQAVAGPEHLGHADFQPLFAGVAREIDAPRFEQQSELAEHARAVAAPAARLEAKLVDPGGLDALAAEISAAAGVAYRIRIVRDLVIDAREDRWRVPLDLQAEYQLTRQQVAAASGGHRLEALVRHMAADAVLELQRELAAITPVSAWRQRHLLLRLELDRDLGRRIVRRPVRITRERVAATGPMAALLLWRYARRLRRAANRDRAGPGAASRRSGGE